MAFLFEVAPNLSDKVRLRILESAPDILNTANVVLTEYQETARKTLEQNHEVVNKILDQNGDTARTIYKNYDEAAKALRTLLSDPNASFEEKQYWNSEMFKCLHEMREYDKENKNFLATLDKENKFSQQNILRYAGVASIIVVGLTLFALTGGNFKLENKT